jgi:hypothetical protein
MKSLGLKNLSIDIVELDKANPRIKQYLEMYGDSITSAQIALALSYTGNGDSSTSYQTLRESIKVSQGIIHPIVVNLDENNEYVVIEGNTRLQIYKEFYKIDNNPIWAEIPCIVYEKLTEEEKHKISLQSHLVGPRDWDAYSKAKYLYELSEVHYLPMDSIISMCGGKRQEILKSIDAYRCMKQYYEPLIESMGYDKDIKEYSKFAEYVKNIKAKQALVSKGYSDEDFAKWVIARNIDNAMKVRSIPAIFANNEALEMFLKKNLTEAEKLLIKDDVTTGINLKDVPYELLCQAITSYLEGISFKEIKNLANNPAYESKKNSLQALFDVLSDTLEEVHNKEE